MAQEQEQKQESGSHRQIQIALTITAVLNFGLAVSKIGIGLYAGSLALFGDGIDSATDVLAGLLAVVAARLIARPPDKHYPYGYGRAETLASYLAALLIAVAGLQLMIQSVGELWQQDQTEAIHSSALYLALISAMVKALISIYLMLLARRINSALIRVTALNMRFDILLSGTVFAGIVASLYSNWHFIDAGLALLLGIWIQFNAYGLVKESLVELMDGLKDPELYSALKAACLAVDPECNPHRMRIRRLARQLAISLDIEVDEKLNVGEGHQLARQVEDQVRATLPDVYDVIVHVEPRGNIEEEGYGLAADHVR